ncbi:MAG TPA: amidohydrolase, partial [Terriglobales bacterium]|nr:amidohydrolase [Terriglobales bacterium]
MIRYAVIAVLGCCAASAQSQFLPGVQPFIAANDPVIALEHVRVIDGAGNQPAEDQTIVINHGKIESVGPSDRATIPPNARRMQLSGHTVIPGLVGMHEHLFYPSG